MQKFESKLAQNQDDSRIVFVDVGQPQRRQTTKLKLPASVFQRYGKRCFVYVRSMVEDTLRYGSFSPGVYGRTVFATQLFV